MLNINAERYGRFLLNGVELDRLQLGTGEAVKAVPVTTAKAANVQLKPTRVVKNLFDKTTVTADRYINSSGVVTSDGTNRTVVSGKISIKPSTAYTLSGVGDIYTASYSRSGYQYQADDTPISAITYTSASGTVTFTTASNCAYIRMMCVTENVDTGMLEEGSTAQPFYPHFAPTTVLSSLKVHGKTEKTVVIDGKHYVVPSDVELATDITNATSSTNVNTGVYANDNIEIFVRFKAITGSFYILQAREKGSGKIYGISGSQTNNTITSFGITSGINRTNGHIYTVKVTMVNRAVTLYVKDETAGTEDTKTGTASSSDYPFPSPTTLKLFGDASKVDSGVTVYDAYIKVNGAMAWYMCGAKKNDTVGVFDPISGQFITPTGSLTAGEATHTVRTAQLVSFNADGIIKLNANFTSGVVTQNNDRWALFIPVVGGQTYSFKVNDNAKSVGWYLCQVEADTVTIGTSYKIDDVSTFVNLKGYDSHTLTTNSKAKWIGINVSLSKSAAEPWFDGGITMVEGSTVPAQYIPYTIEVPLTELWGTGDKTANLFDKANRTRIPGFFASTGTTWTYNASAYSNKIPCKPNTTYTARYNGNSTQAVLGFGSCSTDAEPSASTQSVTVTQGVRQTSPTLNTPVTITTGPNDKWLIVAYNIAEPQHTDMADNLQIEEGSTATPYIPYGYAVDMLLYGKNLLVPSVHSADGLTEEISADGRIHIYGTCTRTTSGYGIGSYNLPAGTYALSCSISGNYGSITSITFNSLSGLTFGQEKTVSKSSPVSSSAGIAIENGVQYDFYITPQIEEGSTATPYEPYIRPENHTIILSHQLHGVGDYADSVDFQTGADVGNVLVVVADGTNVGVANSKQGNVWIVNASGDKVSAKTEIICSHFPYSTGSSSTAPDHTCMSFASYQFGFRADEFSTAAEVNAWLAAQNANDTPVTFVIPAATPTTTTVPVTPIALTEKAQYSAENVNSVKGDMQATYMGVGV